jgi:biopolymer transport protein ExbD
MLLTRQKRVPGAGQLNLASMVDVVFLLLIFFMCTSSFRGLENDLTAQLPRIGAGKDTSQEDFEPVRIEIARAGAGVRVTCDGATCASFADLADQLEARRAIADVPVIIAGQAAVPFRHMVSALDACHQAGLRRVAFSAKGADP